MDAISAFAERLTRLTDQDKALQAEQDGIAQQLRTLEARQAHVVERRRILAEQTDAELVQGRPGMVSTAFSSSGSAISMQPYAVKPKIIIPDDDSTDGIEVVSHPAPPSHNGVADQHTTSASPVPQRDAAATQQTPHGQTEPASELQDYESIHPSYPHIIFLRQMDRAVMWRAHQSGSSKARPPRERMLDLCNKREVEDVDVARLRKGEAPVRTAVTFKFPARNANARSKNVGSATDLMPQPGSHVGSWESDQDGHRRPAPVAPMIQEVESGATRESVASLDLTPTLRPTQDDVFQSLESEARAMGALSSNRKKRVSAGAPKYTTDIDLGDADEEYLPHKQAGTRK